jgi:hypothetical protein
MQTILVVYGLGLVICILVGVALSAVLFRNLDAVLADGTPRSSTAPISRIVKLSFILAALFGGISAKFYSCDYRYGDLIGNPAGLAMKVFGQVEGALRWLLVFLLLLAVVILVAAAARTRTSGRTGG